MWAQPMLRRFVRDVAGSSMRRVPVQRGFSSRCTAPAFAQATKPVFVGHTAATADDDSRPASTLHLTVDDIMARASEQQRAVRAANESLEAAASQAAKPAASEQRRAGACVYGYACASCNPGALLLQRMNYRALIVRGCGASMSRCPFVGSMVPASLPTMIRCVHCWPWSPLVVD